MPQMSAKFLSPAARHWEISVTGDLEVFEPSLSDRRGPSSSATSSRKAVLDMSRSVVGLWTPFILNWLRISSFEPCLNLYAWARRIPRSFNPTCKSCISSSTAPIVARNLAFSRSRFPSETCNFHLSPSSCWIFFWNSAAIFGCWSLRRLMMSWWSFWVRSQLAWPTWSRNIWSCRIKTSPICEGNPDCVVPICWLPMEEAIEWKKFSLEKRKAAMAETSSPT